MIWRYGRNCVKKNKYSKVEMSPIHTIPCLTRDSSICLSQKVQSMRSHANKISSGAFKTYSECSAVGYYPCSILALVMQVFNIEY